MHHTNFYQNYPGLAPQTTPPAALATPSLPTKGGIRRPRNRAGLLVFAAFLLLLGLGVSALLLLAGRAPSLQFKATSPFSPPAADTPFYGWEGDQNTPVGPTTIERAPLAQGVSLTLSPTAGDIRSFQDIYDKCIPSIVSVRTSLTDNSATGTGVVLTADGYIITNYHVIQSGHRVDVVLQNGRRYKALLVGGDQQNDLAVLKIDATDLTPAEFGSSDTLRVGDVALAIGNPLGEELRGTMTEGIISAINRDVYSDGGTMSLIQTSAALNSGSSGGALLNQHGQVVGITNMKMTSYYNTVEGLGFAIPSTTTKQVVDALLTAGHLGGRPSIGITGVTLTAEDAALDELVAGVYVSEVEPKSDAWAQGLRPGAVITQCNGKAVTTVNDINALKLGLVAGDILSLQVYQEGAYIDMEVALVERYELDE